MPACSGFLRACELAPTLSAVAVNTARPLAACLPACLPAHLPTSLPACLSACLHARLSTPCPPACSPACRRGGEWYEARLDAKIPGTVLLRDPEGYISFITFSTQQVGGAGKGGRGGGGRTLAGEWVEGCTLLHPLLTYACHSSIAATATCCSPARY